MDGNQIATLKAKEELVLCRSDKRVQMIFFDENYFFHNLSSRLSWI